MDAWLLEANRCERNGTKRLINWLVCSMMNGRINIDPVMMAETWWRSGVRADDDERIGFGKGVVHKLPVSSTLN